MRMQALLIFFVVFGSLVSCRSKEKEVPKNFISLVSLIRKQVAHVDSSLYSIMKIECTDSTCADTSYIPREKFAEAARDFLEAPDLSDKQVARRYREEPAVQDALLNRVIITYTTLHPEKEEFKKQELLATPVPGQEAHIKNIILYREINTGDSQVQKNMLWQIDKSFQVTTVIRKPGAPEKMTTTKVSWNE